MARIIRLALACICVVVLACGGDQAPSPAPDFDAPVRARAAVSLEPPTLQIGEVADIEVLVVAPPAHRVSPVQAHEVAGISLLGIESAEPERSTTGWTHRTRFRVRAEAVGAFEWPGQEIRIESDAGEVYALELPSRTFEVASVRASLPERDEPFGLEELETDAQPGASPGFFAGIVLGILLSALTAVAIVLARRRSERHAEAVPDEPPPVANDLFAWTKKELTEALEVLEADPRRAASAGAHLMRVYMARRFGSVTEAATTEELERREPALAERSSWPDFVRILHHFDDERFRPSRSDAGAGDRVRSALEDSRRLIESSNP